MNDQLLEEIIDDYERLLGIVTHRLNELKVMRRGGDISKTKPLGNSIKEQIEAKRREIMAQLDAAPRNAPINRSKKKDG